MEPRPFWVSTTSPKSYNFGASHLAVAVAVPLPTQFHSNGRACATSNKVACFLPLMFHSTIPGPATAIAPRTQRNPASRQPFLNLNGLPAKAIASLSLGAGVQQMEGGKATHFINPCRRAVQHIDQVLCCETISISIVLLHAMLSTRLLT